MQNCNGGYEESFVKIVALVIAVLFALWLAKFVFRLIVGRLDRIVKASPQFCGYCYRRGQVAWLVNSPRSEAEPTYSCDACVKKIMPDEAREWAVEKRHLVPVKTP